MDTGHYRKEYTHSQLQEEDLNYDPIKQFSLWFQEAIDKQLLEPNAMILATCHPTSGPTLRTVLLKHFDKSGFTFFTNYSSCKAQQIQSIPQVSLLFSWLPLERQIRITGTASKTSAEISATYFSNRPRASQISAWVSQQSQPILNKSILEQKWKSISKKFTDIPIPLPPFWGGYRVAPLTIEFWQGQPNRLHDRIIYTKNKAHKWQITRLSP